MKLYLSIFTLLFISFQAQANTNPDLKLALNSSPLHTIENPLQIDLKNFEALNALSMDQHFIFQGTQITDYKFDLLQYNNLHQVSIKQEIVVKAEMKIKSYPTILNPTLNQDNTLGKGIYIAPRMILGSGNEYAQLANVIRQHFIQPTLDLGYDFAAVNYTMEIFAGAGLAYTTDFTSTENIYNFQTGLIVNL